MNGLIIINKPKGMTSFDCIFHLRKKLNIKRIGHAGTLDPLASGVLVCAIGEACKALEFLENDDKTYQFSVCLGISTDTLDLEGTIQNEEDIIDLTNQDIDNVLSSLTGVIKQIPPIYSAIKKDGRPLYSYARQKIDVQIDAREVEIYELKRISDVKIINKKAYCTFIAKVSKGTYIRSLAQDIGRLLGGIPSVVTDLIRLQSGKFSLKDCLNLEDLDSFKTEFLLNVLDYLNFPIIELKNNPKLFKMVNHGMKIDSLLLANQQIAETITFSYDHQILGIYHYHQDLKRYVPQKIWPKEDVKA